ncbi:hypothetical protein GCM10007971_25700 [Oceanobacillus indicireducens]|uniref:Uncharacterized protein n=1 Tax=Oceanobacillus indicireducens TaxID=1004261 RepID=A0A918D3A8_9BACI|nr:hypothetical protein GCM10007971_25700 [Oceanobacillus indicireducens]
MRSFMRVGTRVSLRNQKVIMTTKPTSEFWKEVQALNRAIGAGKSEHFFKEYYLSRTRGSRARN